MSHDEEELLCSMALRAPSARLDARVGQLLAAARSAQMGKPGHRIALWQCVAACVACAAAAFLVGAVVFGRGKTVGGSTEVRYVVQVEHRAFDVFDWTKYPKNTAPSSLLKKYQTSVENKGTI